MPFAKKDIYLTPADENAAAWTYVMTHENGHLGPYFCRSGSRFGSDDITKKGE